MNQKKYLGTVQLVLVILFVAASTLLSVWIGRPRETVKENRGDETAFFVEVQQVTAGPYLASFSTTGIVQARTTIQVIPQVSGRVVAVNPEFSSGGNFQSGELLFQIDPAESELEIQRLEAEVARATTALQLEKAEGQVALAEWTQEHGGKTPSPLAAREPQLKEAKANLQASEANLANAQLRLERTSFRLPKAGRVMTSRIAVGQFVQAGVSYGEVFYTDSLEVSSSLDGQELDWLYRSGLPEVEIRVRHLGREYSFEGKLNRGAAVLDASTRFGTVYFGFRDEPADLVPGVFAEVTIVGPLLDEISLLPLSAVQHDGRVWLLDEDQRLTAVNPAIIHRTLDWVAVRRIEEASHVVTSLLSGATEGSLAMIRKPQSYTLAYNAPTEDNK